MIRKTQMSNQTFHWQIYLIFSTQTLHSICKYRLQRKESKRKIKLIFRFSFSFFSYLVLNKPNSEKSNNVKRYVRNLV